MAIPAYEKLASFYLGRVYDPARGQVTEDLVLYDAKDLTTHAVCVGMTGSGKTGLCLSILEEAAIDGIPAIAIDPKGDLGNLLLAFPDLRPEDFRAWVEPEEAARKGMTVDEYARKVADTWRSGLAAWGQDGERIRRFREAADVAIYTPGSAAGIPLRVLQSFAAPPPALRADADAMRERVMSAVSGLLALLGIEADPVRGREHILLSNLLDRAWRDGRDLQISDLIREVQQPPFDRIGVMDLESIYPAKDRFGLAMALNNLLASPGFQAWMEGEALDVQRLLYTPEGKPRLSILSIAHLSDAERMFFVTLLLGEVVAWMRAQPGSSSLKALLYMDEVFGFLPPTANPPSKVPMLTLLKQARAFGLGIVLATQNPVDLDYKALSNAGTWFLGRLQTERDKARVLDGLEGASASAGQAFDRARTETILSGLQSRVFLLNNVHEEAPVVFQTRWALSYLRGPLTRAQIQTLMAARKAGLVAAGGGAGAPPAPATPTPERLAPKDRPEDERPVLPPGVSETFLSRARALPRGASVVYRPHLLARTRARYARATYGVDQFEERTWLASLPPRDAPADPWGEARGLEGGRPPTQGEPEAGARFAPLPAEAAQKKAYAGWEKALADHVGRERPLVLWRHAETKTVSKPGEREGDFRVRLAQADRERRDLDLERLRQRYAPKAEALKDRIRRAEQRVDVEKEQYQQAKAGTFVSIGATILGALFGRKKVSAGTIGRAGTSVRGAGRAYGQKQDVERAEENVDALRKDLADLEEELRRQVDGMATRADPSSFVLEEVPLRAKRSDVQVLDLALAWTPWRVTDEGVAEPLFP